MNYKKNILLITPRTYPVPAVKGGAVEQLIEILLKNNTEDSEIKYTVYTPYSSLIKEEDISEFKNVEFRFVKQNSIRYLIKKYFYGFVHRIGLYFNQSNVFIEEIIKDVKLRGDEFDKIIIENDYTSILKCKKDLNGKIILHMHNDYLTSKTRNAKKIIKNCDEIWCVSHYIEKNIKKIYKDANTIVIENCIDREKFLMNKKENIISEIKKKYDICEDDFIVIYVGRLLKAKGVIELIDAYNDFCKKKKTKLLIVGWNNKKPYKEDKYTKEIKRKIRNNSKIKLCGKIKYDELVNYYSCANCQIIPSKWNEAFGLVTLEGMLCKIPIIASNAGAISEVLHGTGIVIDKENLVKEIKEELEVLYENRKLCKQIGEKEYSATKIYSVENYANKIIKRLDKDGDKKKK